MTSRGDAPWPTGDPAAAQRYSRQLVLDDLGPSGQRALRRARVLVVGAGGLGSAALTHLVAVGVGTVGIADDDVVELSNLHRQVIHGESDLGRPKVHSAAARLADLNSTVRVRRHSVRVDDSTALDLVREYHLVIDACDNHATRHALSRACVALGRPHVWGAVATTSGQLAVWWAVRGPCLRCVFPHTEPVVVDASRVGVLGPVPAVIGTLQAIEAVKIITGAGRPVVGRMLLYEAMAARWEEVAVRPRAGCPCRAVEGMSDDAAGGVLHRDARPAEDVLELVDAIPPGRVVTYGDLAARLGSVRRHRVSARAVGLVMAREGAAVAWWRVVNAAGRLPAHLEAEGIRRWRIEGTPTLPGQPERVDLPRARFALPLLDTVVGGQ